MENNKECYRISFKPTNRHYKRLMEAEAKRIDKFISPIEKQFIADLMDDRNMSYAEIYKFHHGRFIESLRLAYKTVKPKYVSVNPKYFFEMYAQSKPKIRIGWGKRLATWFKKLFHA